MNRMTRRGFLGRSAAAATLFSLPAGLYSSSLLAADAPSERIRLGCIGVGNQGRGNMKAFGKGVVAVCEIDKTRLAEATAAGEKQTGHAPAAHADYRKMLEMKDLDAVVITTPDHWHALQTIHACQAGKDVYCEKPLTLTVVEGQKMVAAARKHDRVVQTGSQQRSAKEFRTACELVRNGAIGDVHTVKVGLPGPNWVDRAKHPVPDSAPPAELDYNVWLGPAPERPFNANRVHYLFRFFWDYSGGQQTNFGAHHLDIAQWGLGMDESGPTHIEGTATFNKDKWFETPETAHITYTYANKVKVLCSLGSKGYAGGTTFEGSKGVIHVNRGRIEVKIGGEKVDPAKIPGGDIKLYVSNDHHKNFLECIKSRKKPICDVAIGHRSATVCHLGNIALRSGKKLDWDPVKETFAEDTQLVKWLDKEYRKPWSLG